MKPPSQSSRIWILVACIHLVGIAFISSSPSSKSPHKKLLVVTKEFKAPSTQAAPAVIEKIREHIPTSPTVKKAPLPTKKAKPAPPKPLPKSSKQVLKKIDKRLSKPHLPLPKQIPPPSPEETLQSYVDSACLIFRDILVLPEKGLVKLTITVQPNGKIGKIEIETFESKKNLDYLMTVLPTLSLPIPERGKDATFTVLFCND